MNQANNLPKMRLLIAAASLVTAVRLSLWLLPFGFLRRQATSLSAPLRRSSNHKQNDSAAICRSIMIVSQYIPRATCLTQALAAQMLLGRHGHAGHLCIGVGNPASRLRAHAWLEDDNGEILIGHTDRAQFVVLPSIDAAVA